MKRLFKPLLLLTTLICFAACNPPSEPTKPVIVDEGASNQTMRPRRSNSPSYTSYLVNEQDIDAYVHYLNVIQDSERGSVVDVTPVEHDGQIVYYIINLEQGWLLLSSDKRGPIILAESDSGSFCLDEVNDGVQTWIDGLVDDIEYRWYCEDEYYAKNWEHAQEYEDYCLDTWRAINADPDYIIENIVETKVYDGPIIILDPPGHYELTSTYNIQHTYELVQHLMSSKWSQIEHFNFYFPYKHGSSTEKCPAGCVPVAAAQVLRYLHDYLGEPSLSPSYGFCSGEEYGYYMEFGNYSDSTWSYMLNTTDNTPFHYAAMLIGDLAVKLDATITSTGTFANDADLPEDVFLPFGISCNYVSSYSSSTVYQNLLNNLPVIFSGYRYENMLSWPGHCFVIDGYETYATTTYYVYTWVYDILPPEPGQGNVMLPEPPDNIVQTSTSSPYLQYFYLNWGAGGGHYDTPYATDGNWAYDSTPYQFNKSMVYGFSTL